MISVIIVDDQKAIRYGYEMALNASGRIKVIKTLANGLEAVDYFRNIKDKSLIPDVILMDIRMPHCDGIKATRQIKALFPEINILALTTYDQDNFAFGMLEAGASGFLLKGLRTAQMVAALESIHAGDSVITPRITKQLLQKYLSNSSLSSNKEIFKELTSHELEIVELVATGLNNAEIAQKIFIQPDSVKKSISRILAKTGLRDRTQLAISWCRKRAE